MLSFYHVIYMNDIQNGAKPIYGFMWILFWCIRILS